MLCHIRSVNNIDADLDFDTDIDVDTDVHIDTAGTEQHTSEDSFEHRSISLRCRLRVYAGGLATNPQP